MLELDQVSRYKQTEFISFGGVETLGKWVPPSFLVTRPPEDQIGVFQVTTGVVGRPDKIANILYGDSRLYWVLVSFNNVRDIRWPMAGDLIEYPIEDIVLPAIV